MATKIEEIEGIGPALGEKLRNVGIKSVEDLLAKCGQNAGREAVAAETAIVSEKIMRKMPMRRRRRLPSTARAMASAHETKGSSSKLRLPCSSALVARMNATSRGQVG